MVITHTHPWPPFTCFTQCGASRTDRPRNCKSVPRFEPASCQSAGAEEWPKPAAAILSCRKIATDRPGRTIKLMVANSLYISTEKRADPVEFISGGPGHIAHWRSTGPAPADFSYDRDIVVMSQRCTTSRAGVVARPSTTLPAESFSASASTPRRRKRRAFGPRRRPVTATSPPPAPISAPTTRQKVPPISPTSARRSAMKLGCKCSRDVLWLLSCADAHAPHPEGIRSLTLLDFGLANDLQRRRKLAKRARWLRQSLPGLRSGSGLQRGPTSLRLKETFNRLVNSLRQSP